eukprot:COSAG02_NODE_11171_length_1777_cov_2.868892_1_plen_409_part_00
MSKVARRITTTFAQGSAEEREAAYVEIEDAVRVACSLPSGSGGNRHDAEDAQAEAVALVVGCVQPLIAEVLCASAAKVGWDEHVRAALLLFEMYKADLVAVCVELWRKDDAGAIPFCSIFVAPAPDNAHHAMLAKDPSEWTRDDAIIAAASLVPFMGLLACGGVAILPKAGLGEMEMLDAWMVACPYLAETSHPVDHYLPLAMLLLDLVRSQADTQPEGVLAGVGGCVCQIVQGKPPLAKAVYEAGFLEVFDKLTQRYNPMQRISKTNHVSTAWFSALKDVVEGAQAAGCDLIQPLLDVGALDSVISALNAYQMMGKPEEANVIIMQWSMLNILEILLKSTHAAPIVSKKLRGAGADSFRYLLDNPLVNLPSVGFETGSQATRIAAMVRVSLFSRRHISATADTPFLS